MSSRFLWSSWNQSHHCCHSSLLYEQCKEHTPWPMYWRRQHTWFIWGSKLEAIVWSNFSHFRVCIHWNAHTNRWPYVRSVTDDKLFEYACSILSVAMLMYEFDAGVRWVMVIVCIMCGCTYSCQFGRTKYALEALTSATMQWIASACCSRY